MAKKIVNTVQGHAIRAAAENKPDKYAADTMMRYHTTLCLLYTSTMLQTPHTASC